MHDDGEQQLLFGAKEGTVTRVVTTMERDPVDLSFRVTVKVFTTMRFEPRTIDVYCQTGEDASEAFDMVSHISHKMIWCREDTVRHHLRKALDQLIDKGFEVKSLRTLRS